MNLAQLAQYVCTKARQPDSASIATCKTFLTARANMLWTSALWRQALGLVTYTMDPIGGTSLDAQGVWILPNSVDLVVAIRDSNMQYRVQDVESYFRVDTDEFAASGASFEFYTMPKAAFTFQSVADALAIYVSQVADDGAQIQVRAVKTTGVLYNLDWTISGGGSAQTNFISGLTEITSVTKPVTQGNVFVGTQAEVTVDPEIQLASTDTNAFQYARVRIMEMPTVALNLRALVKRYMPSFTSDNDTFALVGFDNVLIAFALGDMLQFGRFYAKAAEVFKEANSLLENLKTVEVFQQAMNPRIIPDAELVWDRVPYGDNWLRGPN